MHLIYIVDHTCLIGICNPYAVFIYSFCIIHFYFKCSLYVSVATKDPGVEVREIAVEAAEVPTEHLPTISDFIIGHATMPGTIIQLKKLKH